MPQVNDPFAELDMKSGASAPLAGRSSSASGGLAGRSSVPKKPSNTRGGDVATQNTANLRRKPSPARYAAPAASQADPFADMDFVDVDDANYDERHSRKSRKTKKQKVAFFPNKKVKKSPDQIRTQGAGLFTRIRRYFKSTTPKMMYLDALNWLASHPYVIILVCVIFIGIGMFFGRYISFGAAFTLAILGALMSREDLDTAGYICYGCAFADFLIPYLV